MLVRITWYSERASCKKPESSHVKLEKEHFSVGVHHIVFQSTEKKKDQNQTKRKPQQQKPSSVNFKIKLEKLERQMKMLVVHFQCAQRNLPLMPALICQEPRRSVHLCKLSAYLSSCTMTLWVILYASGLVFT